MTRGRRAAERCRWRATSTGGIERAREMVGRVAVFARVRPRDGRGREEDDGEGAEAGGEDGDGAGRRGAWIEDGRVVSVKSTTSVNGVTRRFAVDGAFDGRATQREVYAETCAPVLEAVRSGCRGCVLAYGQTGSGKTYSLLNGGGDRDEREASTSEGGNGGPGLVPRIAVDCFARAASDARHAYEVSCAMAQIYNEQVDDLVAKKSGLRVVPASDGSGWEIENLSWTPCRSAEDVLECFRRGRSRLVYAETHMNKQSSRSHCVFQMKIERIERPIEADVDRDEDEDEDGTAQLVAVEKRLGLLTIVDLAGSERQKKTQNVGARFKEALNINTSLLALGNVVSALAAGHRHIPYRDSTLTKILEPSLNGKSRTVLLVCVSSEIEHANESANSLDFATRAMRIVTSPEVRSSLVDMDPRKLTQQLRGQCDDEAVARLMDEVTSLRRALANATKSSEDDINAMKKSRDSLQHEICSARLALESSKRALEQAKSESTTKTRELDAIENQRSALDSRVRTLVVKLSTSSNELQNERAKFKEESARLVADARKLDAQLSAERASASHTLKRMEHLNKLASELKVSNDSNIVENAKLKAENVRLRSTVGSQRMDNARLMRRHAALESKHALVVAERAELVCECESLFIENKFMVVIRDALAAACDAKISEMTRRYVKVDAIRARHSMARRAAARRSTERTAILMALERSNKGVLKHVRDLENHRSASDERYARELAAARAEGDAHRQRAKAAARLHALSADRQLERGLVLTKLARNGKRYDRLVRIDPFTGALEAAQLPRRFKKIAPRRAASDGAPTAVDRSPSLAMTRDDQRDVVSISLQNRTFDIEATHGADLVWGLALARRFGVRDG